MEYKSYNISEVNSLLLLDILQVQQDILAKLKQQFEANIDPVDTDARRDRISELIQQQDSPEVAEAIVQATNQIEALAQEVEKPVKKPAPKKPTQKKSTKKTKSKKATK